MINNKYILSLCLLCAIGVQGSVIPSNYIDSYNTRLFDKGNGISKSQLDLHSSVEDLGNSDQLSQDFVIPTSIEKYVSQWQELYNNFRFHSAIHQPASQHFDSSSVDRKGESIQRSDSDGVNRLKFENEESEVSLDEEEEDDGAQIIDLTENGYQYQYYPLDDNPQEKDSKILEYPLFEDTFQYIPPDEKGMDSDILIPNGALDTEEVFPKNSDLESVELDSNSPVTMKFKVFKRDTIEYPSRKLRRSLESHSSKNDIKGDINNEFYNDELGVDEYEFGYDDRDAYVDNAPTVNTMDVELKNMLDEDAEADFEASIQASVANISVKTNTTMNETGRNDTYTRGLNSTQNVEAMNTSVCISAEAILSFVIGIAAVSIML